MNRDELNGYLEFAKELAYEAGEIIRKYFSNTELEWKADQTPLTIADTAINQMVIDRIHGKFSDHSVFGEEQSVMKQGSRFTWVCDPVDGTLPYSHGLPISTFSLALCEDGRPIVGVVYDPFMDRLFCASLGQGAFLNNKKIHVNKGSFERAVIEVQGFGNVPTIPMVVECSNSIKDTLNQLGAKTTQLWSCILPSVLVASGDYTAVIMNGSTVQDGSAIKIIVEEAGGRVTDIYGNDQRYDELSRGFIASNGVVHDELVKLIKEETK